MGDKGATREHSNQPTNQPGFLPNAPSVTPLAPKIAAIFIYVLGRIIMKQVLYVSDPTEKIKHV